MCRSLCAVYVRILALFPDLEAARPRSTSGIQALCSLHIALEKTKNVLQHCADCIMKFERTRRVLADSLTRVEDIVPRAIGSQIAEIIGELTEIDYRDIAETESCVPSSWEREFKDWKKKAEEFKRRTRAEKRQLMFEFASTTKEEWRRRLQAEEQQLMDKIEKEASPTFTSSQSQLLSGDSNSISSSLPMNLPGKLSVLGKGLKAGRIR
ncbi:hypothetical protein CASFOL_036876 [Castilleja foliolosa]|uniref:Uncharacterized protein n=1 Tax=Castilleja foliolosa TaxID=1961234 RepID=A0ABD3BQ99_9LAMI